jgi:hypothetical protein
MPRNPRTANWWITLPGILTAAAGFLTALTGLIIGLNQAGILPVRTKPVASAAPQSTVGSVSTSANASQIPLNATELCSAKNDTWGKKSCGSTTIVFQPVYSGSDSAIITTNVGSEPIWIRITPDCSVATQCGKEWVHIVNPVANAGDGTANENLTVNEPGVHAFDWTAYR